MNHVALTENAKTVREVDAIVGQNLRLIRLQRGMTQEKLADAAGITFQQVQKYEKGTNRISASRMVEFCHTLNTDIEALFRGVDGIGAAEKSPEHVADDSEVALLRAFRALDDERKADFIKMIKAVAK
ncbi:MAG: transcriptional regulator [Rhizobiales bacterium]|nr:transcriptional regulator [Hoeflea sp.]MBG19397.1 transcriptional regulator [Hyphomicrobiales bacterium]|tara:strand:- start:3762 stop:4145 length:384 start_codon:yes stop_codon:yes gene_type:complete